MIRFRNPGTQYSTQIQVIKQLYEALSGQENFTLDDMAVVIAQGRLMTAYGYAGDDALRLSNTEQESMNSAKMNAKMYAEVFRMLGWVTPYSESSSYPLVFTYIGAHIALSTGDCSRLYEQCVLGINNPTQLTDNMSYNEKLRFFQCALRTFIDLDGIMYKHELCLGPMSVDDEDEKAYQNMIAFIRSIRGSQKRLNKAFLDLAVSLRMKPTPVDNCTRLPIAFMKSCGWVESINDSSLYGKSMACLKITQHGIETYDAIKVMYDLRLDKYLKLEKNVQQALIRLGTYSMLERSGYDMSSVDEIIRADKVICEGILQGKELLFSPCQTLRRKQVEEALGIQMDVGTESRLSIGTFESAVAVREALANTDIWDLNISHEVSIELLGRDEEQEFLKTVNKLYSDGYSSGEIVNELFDYYIDATQITFYPLIATLFKIMGFNCSFSRPGDNGARWDAIIDDPIRSIPIEIKSPTEEQFLSIKAIRQALENKIILLSRKTHVTTPEVTTLAVGYYMPNERAEVNRLIADFKATYGYSIGVIDLKSLLSISVSILTDKKTFDKEKLYSLEGLANANI
ncbi:hypothetical protein [Ruminiclostridium cellobioparum]|uniref:hypothetical protein n=1 Tax=Ruminiclostridium cellobioparum TaxID=29355 RepID=UPI00047F3553|nr:hypothetical protein [Ruminiclostridium cellobioparum]